MPRPVPERLRDLEAEVRNMQVMPAAAVRARGRSRGRRQLAAMVAAGAVVTTTVGIAFAWPQQRAEPTADRPVVSPSLSCVVALPSGTSDVRVRVLDGGTSAGLLDATVDQLRTRRFTVLNGTAGDHPADGVTLRYGPAAIGAAALMRAEMYGEVSMLFDPERRDDTIDLILGPAFTRLATPTEVNQNLVSVGEPTAPPQCSPTPGR